MRLPRQIGAPDYLVIGHIAADITPEGMAIGGTAAYAGLTANVLGLRVGILTSTGPEIDLRPLSGLDIRCLAAEKSTTFENLSTSQGRRQILHARALDLSAESVPRSWRRTPLVHLAPIANEVNPSVIGRFSNATLCLTPQGWLRTWDKYGMVTRGSWAAEEKLLRAAAAVVLSLEDVEGDEEYIQTMAQRSRLLVITEGKQGARIYWGKEFRRLEAPAVKEIDSTGAGDIFAACYFIRLYQTRDPWEAARFALELSAASIARTGLASIPTRQEIKSATERLSA